MSIALIRPPISKWPFYVFRYPLNLAGLYSFLKKYNFDVDLYDLEAYPNMERDLYNNVKDRKYKIVGISCYTPTINSGHNIATQVKSVSSKVITVVGGPHSTAMPKGTLEEFSNFDVVVVGEGEITLLELVKAAYEQKDFNGILGIVYRRNGDIKIEKERPLIENLDDLPFPARELFNFDVVKTRLFDQSFTYGSLGRSTEILTARGCPHRCIFCSNFLAYSRSGNRVRFRKIENVLGEVEKCKSKYGINHFFILDDDFTLRQSRVFKICNGLKKFGVTWFANAHIGSVNFEMLEKMAKSGCKKIIFGVESDSSKILDLIEKDITLADIIRAFKFAHKAGFGTIHANFIIGSHPDEDIDDVNKTIDIIKKIKPHSVQVTVACPYPGTELYNIMKERNLIKGQKWDEYYEAGIIPQWHTENFNPRDLLRLQAKIYRRFYYTSPFVLFNRLKRVRNLTELKDLFIRAKDFYENILLR